MERHSGLDMQLLHTASVASKMIVAMSAFCVPRESAAVAGLSLVTNTKIEFRRLFQALVCSMSLSVFEFLKLMQLLLMVPPVGHAAQQFWASATRADSKLLQVTGMHMDLYR